MIAKFHSAPGHSMETTLTINIPPPERIRAARGDRLREKQKDKGEIVQGPSGRIKDREIEDENVMREREDREREREVLERERRALAERGTSYKDKFQKMREKYDRVTTTQDTHMQELDVLNAKIKKIQAENDLLLDAVFLADTALYDRYFPSGPSFGPPPIGHPASQQHPPQPFGPSPHSYPSSKPGHGHAYAQYSNDVPISGLLQHFPTTPRFIDNPTTSSGPPPNPGHYYYQSQAQGQGVEPQEHPLYMYPSREPVLPNPNPPPAKQRPYRHYIPPGHHQGMPPPPPPVIYGSDNERERQREKGWERDMARHEWEWEKEKEGRHPLNKESGRLPRTPPLFGLPPSNGYNPMTLNGHGHIHGPEYGNSTHSLPPPPPVARTHARHSSRSSRSASRRRNEGMMDIDGDMRLPPSHDVDRSLGGPVHLDVDLEGAGEREREGGMGSGRRSRRSSESRNPGMGNVRTPPMAVLEPVVSQHPQRKQIPLREREREGHAYDRNNPASRMNPGDIYSRNGHLDSDSDENWEHRSKYYEQVRRHWGDLGGEMGNSDGREREFDQAREEEEEEEEEEEGADQNKVAETDVMDVDEN